ncbi:hypothetical protein [uncultured Thiohalocapsa sp.]|uniref:hypothetical protein n=1 Tax=uncultured Thiohalocapsa sp. TaxID=768990 RepID=UPI0025D99047|nr:hypothetical protein [uncultured Thiohalocapsa sp.]
MTTALIRCLRPLTAAATVSLGLTALPMALHAALIDITSPQTVPQSIGDGDSLRVSAPDGSIVTNGNAVTATGAITIGASRTKAPSPPTTPRLSSWTKGSPLPAVS